MKSKRHSLVAGFLLATAVFVSACFYIPEMQFHWTVQIGNGEYGLCHVKGMVYFVLGSSMIFVRSAVAAAAVAIIVALPTLVLMFLAANFWSRK